MLLVGLAVVAVHFGLLLVWLLPGSPAAWRDVAQRYVAPLFAQNWWLFAPDPATVDRQVEVRARQAGVGGAWTAWLPVSRTLSDHVRDHRLSTRNAEWIAVLNGMYALTAAGGPLRLQGGARALVLRTWADPASKPAPLVVLERAGARAIEDTAPGRRFDQLQLRVTVRPLASGTGASVASDELLFPPTSWPADGGR